MFNFYFLECFKYQVEQNVYNQLMISEYMDTVKVKRSQKTVKQFIVMFNFYFLECFKYQVEQNVYNQLMISEYMDTVKVFFV